MFSLIINVILATHKELLMLDIIVNLVKTMISVKFAIFLNSLGTNMNISIK